MNVGKIAYLIDSISLLVAKNNELNKEIDAKMSKYNKEKENFNNIADKVYSENKTSINDFKTVFNSMYNADFKKLEETFEDDQRIFYNKGFAFDKEKQMLLFEDESKEEISFSYYRQNNKSLVFFFDSPVDLNLIKLVSKDENGFNIKPIEIIIENSLGKTYFLEDFSRFFSSNETLDVQTYISNLKTISSIEFAYESVPNYALSTYNFFKVSYKEENEVILKYKNIFKDNSIIKLRRNISDKTKSLSYSISFDNGVTFEEFTFTNPDLNGIEFEDDIKIINLPDNVPGDIFLKIKSFKNSKKITNQKVVSTKEYNQNILALENSEENGFEYKLDNQGGTINRDSIKIYFSNKFGNLIKTYNSGILDTYSEVGKTSIAQGFIDTSREYITEDDKFFLMDYDDLESLSNVKSELGFFDGSSLFLPSLFSNEEINFRVRYKVDFYENDTSLETYTPFIFDFDIIGGDS